MASKLVGVIWSEFAAGTTQAQLGHFRGESARLNLAETRVRSVPLGLVMAMLSLVLGIFTAIAIFL